MIHAWQPVVCTYRGDSLHRHCKMRAHRQASACLPNCGRRSLIKVSRQMLFRGDDGRAAVLSNIFHQQLPLSAVGPDPLTIYCIISNDGKKNQVCCCTGMLCSWSDTATLTGARITYTSMEPVALHMLINLLMPLIQNDMPHCTNTLIGVSIR